MQQSEANQNNCEFDLGRLQSWCQQCMTVGNKTGAITLYYKFKQFTDILLHILLNT